MDKKLQELNWTKHEDGTYVCVNGGYLCVLAEVRKNFLQSRYSLTIKHEDESVVWTIPLTEGEFNSILGIEDSFWRGFRLGLSKANMVGGVFGAVVCLIFGKFTLIPIFVLAFIVGLYTYKDFKRLRI